MAWKGGVMKTAGIGGTAAQILDKTISISSHGWLRVRELVAWISAPHGALCNVPVGRGRLQEARIGG